jgi:hypothetical protein
MDNPKPITKLLSHWLLNWLLKLNEAGTTYNWLCNIYASSLLYIVENPHIQLEWTFSFFLEHYCEIRLRAARNTKNEYYTYSSSYPFSSTLSSHIRLFITHLFILACRWMYTLLLHTEQMVAKSCISIISWNQRKIVIYSEMTSNPDCGPTRIC